MLSACFLLTHTQRARTRAHTLIHYTYMYVCARAKARRSKPFDAHPSRSTPTGVQLSYSYTTMTPRDPKNKV